MAETNMDLKELKFGQLTAIEPTDLRKNGDIVWRCLCECGQISFVRSNDLRRGKVRRCGVYKNHRKTVDSMIGERFGSLLVLSVYDKKPYGKYVFFICICDCGENVIASGKHLRSGHTYRCSSCVNKAIAIANTTHGLSKTKEYIYALNRKRREMRRQLDSEWTPLMEICLKSLQTSCVLCGSCVDLTIDHVLPLRDGYGLVPGNAVILCRSCNSKKKHHKLDRLTTESRDKLLFAAESFRVAWSGGF